MLFRLFPQCSRTPVRRPAALLRAMAVMSSSYCKRGATEHDIIRLCSAINSELSRAETPYSLRMSIGYARYGDGINTWQELLRAADAELYRIKDAKKKSGIQVR